MKVVEPGVIYFRELPGAVLENFDATLEVVEELGEPFGDFVVVIDLVDATRPGPAFIERILEKSKTLGIHWCVVDSRSRFMRAVIQFIMRRLRQPHTLHASMEDAVKTAREKLRGSTTKQRVSQA
ncbi:MAG: hypothetical protein KC731_13610 [Myxococcales bacterium]|nr:hypothetical protein [Myxococcales bacterium]